MAPGFPIGPHEPGEQDGAADFIGKRTVNRILALQTDTKEFRFALIERVVVEQSFIVRPLVCFEFQAKCGCDIRP